MYVYGGGRARARARMCVRLCVRKPKSSGIPTNGNTDSHASCFFLLLVVVFALTYLIILTLIILCYFILRRLGMNAAYFSQVFPQTLI